MSDGDSPLKHHINITHVLLDSFLVMLLLLLVGSCAVVFRSFALRRRLRAHIRQALAAGFVVDEQGNIIGEQPRPKPIGEKPIMWEVWVDEKGNEAGEPLATTSSIKTHSGWDEEKSLEGPWQGILPVSVKVIPSISSFNPSLSSLHTSPSPNSVQQTLDPRLPPHSVSYMPPVPEKLEVSVLISMPNPNRRFVHGQKCSNYALGSKGRETEEEGEVPDVLFGVTNVSMKS